MKVQSLIDGLGVFAFFARSRQDNVRFVTSRPRKSETAQKQFTVLIRSNRN
jgi:hypothetical protein